MIVRCPGCGKRISNQQASCPHCGADQGASGAEASAFEAARRRRRQLRYRLEMQSYAALLLTAIGVAWMFLSGGGPDGSAGFWPIACLAVGASWYVGVRVYSIFAGRR